MSNELQSAKIAAKADALMTRIENSVREEPKQGWTQNLYGDYFDSNRFERVLELTDQAERIFPENGDSAYVRAGYLMWAGRLTEAEAAYESVIRSFSSYTKSATLLLAAIKERKGHINEATALVEEYNRILDEENSPLPRQTLERVRFK